MKEPKFPPLAQTPSSFIKDHKLALELWNYLVPHLSQQDLLACVDRPALEALCMSYQRWREAELYLTEHGNTCTTPKGYIQQRPEVSIAKGSLIEMRAIAVEFGLTPSSRTRLKKGPGGKKDEDQEFFGEGDDGKPSSRSRQKEFPKGVNDLLA